ncbi:MAG: PEP-CTERM system histidine kinase PrsK [Colwellia sp.]|nr:PEP-CTERM system histidine kinase PrsK [Colwellia sp.]
MEWVGISGYMLSACAYLVFILLLLAARNKTLSGRLVLFSSIFVFTSSIVSIMQIDRGLSLQVVLALETIKLALWSLLILATQNNLQVLSQLLKHPKIKKYFITWLVLSASLWIIAFYTLGGSKYLFLLFLALNLWTLVLLEQLYRNMDVKAKWAIWPLVIGIGTATVFDFIMFAQASMVNQLDFNYWYARGYISALAMPFILVSTRRIKNWSVNVFISREVVFYSSLLMISGGYLLLLALAGYVINYIGGEWGQVISIAFFILGGTVLTALIMTEKLRREVKVFITKHFFANKYDYRIEWLKSIEQLEIGSSDDYYKTAVDIIGLSLKVTNSALVKKDKSGSFACVYSQGIVIDKIHINKLVAASTFCQEHRWILDIREYATIEESYPGLKLDLDYCIELNIDILVPIYIGKSLYGFFVLALPSGGGILNWEDRDLLFALSKQLSNYLSLNEANAQLAESKQFDAFNRMSAFLVHDLKNIQAQLSLIHSNAKRHRDNPEFIDDVFETIDSATSRLDKVLSQLRNKQVSETVKTQVSIKRLIDKVVEQRNLVLPAVSSIIEDDIAITIEEETLMSVLNHLVQNAQEATNPEGWVKVKASILDQELHLAVLDNGCGMTDEFIQKRLFKPFDTTKGNAGMGIGVYEAKQFVESLGGSMQVTSFENEGSIFQLIIPIT